MGCERSDRYSSKRLFGISPEPYFAINYGTFLNAVSLTTLLPSLVKANKQEHKASFLDRLRHTS